MHFYTWKKEKTIRPSIEMHVVKNGSVPFNQVKKINKERENASINYEWDWK